MNLLKEIPYTRIKIFIGSIIYRLLKIIYPQEIIRIERNGIYYEIDISEGIDLSLFLFGNFQKDVLQNKLISMPMDAVVVDVGANIGTMTLGYAKNLPKGHVFAFEPTFYAFEKLKRNVALNPSLKNHITLVQNFVAEKSGKHSKQETFSSWSLKNNKHAHPIHGGLIMSAKNINSVSLDDFFKKNKVNSINLIKIDTDGYEFDVLKGSINIIKKYKPYILFECGLYLLNER